jgi:hypothetical protein
VEVDVIDAEPLQAGLYRFSGISRRPVDAGAGLLGREAETELAGDHQPVAMAL